MIILFPDKGLNTQTDRKLKVHQRITLRHPEIATHDVEAAWRNAVAMRLRTMEPPAHIILEYHAQKLTAKMQAELGL